jgi:hypothetical protein
MLPIVLLLGFPRVALGCNPEDDQDAFDAEHIYHRQSQPLASLNIAILFGLRKRDRPPLLRQL